MVLSVKPQLEDEAMVPSMPHTAQIIPFPRRFEQKLAQVDMPSFDYSSACWYHADAILKEQSPQPAPKQVS